MKPASGAASTLHLFRYMCCCARRQRRILIRRQRGVRPTVSVPVAVVSVVIVVMLRPHVLRHSRYDAQQKPSRAVEPATAKQAAVAAFVHQAKDAHGKQDDGQQGKQGEPRGYAGAADGDPPEEMRGTKVVKTCCNPLMSSDLVYRPIIAHFWRLKQSFDTTIDCPPASTSIVSLVHASRRSTRAKARQYGPRRRSAPD